MGEEVGFVGCLLVLGIFLFLVARAVRVARNRVFRMKSLFSQKWSTFARAGVLMWVIMLAFPPAAARAQKIDDSAVRPVFRTSRVTDGRIDMDRGVLRAKYRFESLGPESVGDIMRRQAPGFGWSEDLSDLELIRIPRAGPTRGLGSNDVTRIAHDGRHGRAVGHQGLLGCPENCVATCQLRPGPLWFGAALFACRT